METHTYEPRGKSQGSITNIPSADCRICGQHITQPLPTGLWTHNGRADNDYHDNGYAGECDHIPIPASLIESLLIENKRENRDYGEGECRLHREYWLNQTKLKKKEIKEMIGSKDTGADWHYWGNKNQRINSVSVRNFLKQKKYIPRKKNFPIPKILVVGEISGKPDIEIEIGMSSDWHQENLNTWTSFVKVGKKIYKIGSEARLDKKSPKLNEYRFRLKGSLGKYDKESLEKYYDVDTLPQFEDLFEKYVGFLDGSVIYDHEYKLNE